ncbi:hypothetical protein POJ06DRAFT_286608 [Lipomyces tetrasporus]|uniref:Uncharacterized protein n=1 Tax=Lipomyces tetrasporus TaxID=54092 RepID=A0AAD7QKX7_9ASCO|nr:uncharacterized protein POJ06DRAFT_286608 [Lipomyces tetrasporus]KAJ8097174.1 hypothetical protein POJ06DRAFT_286608 [Lipomyces tetrasporus]
MSIYYGEDASNRVRSALRGAIAIARAQSPPATISVKEAHSLPTKTYKGQIQSQTGAVATLRLQNSISLEMATYDDERLSYQRAMDFLTANEPERRLDVHLSYRSFRYLEEKARALYGDAKYPRVEYSAIDSRVIIHTIPTALHSASAVGLNDCIRDSVRDILRRHDKVHLGNRIMSVGESTYSSVDEQGVRSTKTPDAGLKYDNGQHKNLLLIIEAGVSEGYQQLKADIELWLKKFECQIGILLWLKETPRFRFPADEVGNPGSATERALFENAMWQVRRSRPFGPYRFNGHAWFGTLDTALIEVFKTDVHSNKISSEQYVVVEDGAVTVEGNSLDIGLIMGDVFPFDEELSADEKTEPICLATDTLLPIIESAAQDTAIKRHNDS